MEEIEFYLKPEYCIHKWQRYPSPYFQHEVFCAYCKTKAYINGAGEVIKIVEEKK